MNFPNVQSLTIPVNGKQCAVSQIEVGGKVRWSAVKPFTYVSLGDSIAAGQLIAHETDLNAPQCFAWQYGTWTDDEGRTYSNNETKIIDGCYTDLIRKKLQAKYGADKIRVKSYARSGDKYRDLIDKLTANEGNNPVANAVRQANIVTVCVGANDILAHVGNYVDSYVASGSPTLAEFSNLITAILNVLKDDSHQYSIHRLLTLLYDYNPNAQYVFTTIHNPYKYLWVEESTEGANYKDGFWGPLMWIVPDYGDEISVAIANEIRAAILNTEAVQLVYDRINGPSRNGSDGISAFVEKEITRLNDALKGKIKAFGKPNFVLADTKALFDTVPDRTGPGDVHYNDLVNVEITRGYNTESPDWSRVWDGFGYSMLINEIE